MAAEICAEAGLDALMAAVHKTKFRNGAQRFILLASDAAFHDADYDGKSAYSLDQVIDALQNQQIRVDVIGLDYLPIRQIGFSATGVNVAGYPRSRVFGIYSATHAHC